jgi:hypothetical protein
MTTRIMSSVTCDECGLVVTREIMYFGLRERIATTSWYPENWRIINPTNTGECRDFCPCCVQDGRHEKHIGYGADRSRTAAVVNLVSTSEITKVLDHERFAHPSPP